MNDPPETIEDWDYIMQHAALDLIGSITTVVDESANSIEEMQEAIKLLDELQRKMPLYGVRNHRVA